MNIALLEINVTEKNAIICTFREYNDVIDEVTLEQVFAWRDRLVEATPFICEIKTS